MRQLENQKMSPITCRTIMVCAVMLSLSGCAQTQWRQGDLSQKQTLMTADQTMDLEVTDRVNRFQRLSSLQGVIQPQIDEVTIPADRVPGATRPIPVIRISFDERDFFSSGSAVPRPQAAQVLQIVAQNMQRDVPDVRLTVLGHTDATGGEQVNAALSQQRAQVVLQDLISDGVNPAQLSAVAVGSAQPVAPNSTPNGRARNRRVEFLMSPSEQANFTVVSMRPVNPAFQMVSATAHTTAKPAQRHVEVLKPSYSGPSDFSEAPATSGKNGAISLASAGPDLIIGGEETGSPVMMSGSAILPSSTAPVLETGSPVGSMSANYSGTKP